MSMRVVSLWIPGEPVAKERPRFNRRTGGVYTPRTTLDYEDAVATVAKLTGGPSLGKIEVKLVCVFYLTPRTRQKTPDLDNLLKSLLDGIVKSGLIHDDSQVTFIEADRQVRLPGEEPGVRAWISARNPQIA